MEWEGKERAVAGQQHKALPVPPWPSSLSDEEWHWWQKLLLAFKIKYGQPLFWLAAFSFCN